MNYLVCIYNQCISVSVYQSIDKGLHYYYYLDSACGRNVGDLLCIRVARQNWTQPTMQDGLLKKASIKLPPAFHQASRGFLGAF